MSPQQRNGSADDELVTSGKQRDVAFILQPKKGDEGTWLIGVLAEAKEKTLSPTMGPALVAEFTAAAVKSARGAWESHRAVSIVLNPSIRLRMSIPADIGKVFAIRFDGFEKSNKPGHNDVRMFTVVEQTQEKLLEVLKQAGETDLPF